MSKRKRKTAITSASPPRNPLFNHPMMKKSHVHDKSNKTKRRAEKVRFAREWYCQNSIGTFLTIPFQAVISLKPHLVY